MITSRQLAHWFTVMAMPLLSTAQAQMPSEHQHAQASVVSEMRERLAAHYGKADFDPDSWSDGLSMEQRTTARRCWLRCTIRPFAFSMPWKLGIS